MDALSAFLLLAWMIAAGLWIVWWAKRGLDRQGILWTPKDEKHRRSGG